MYYVVKSAIEKATNKQVVLEKPKNRKLGHFAITLAFAMAKKLKKSPIVIANELVNTLSKIEIFLATYVLL